MKKILLLLSVLMFSSPSWADSCKTMLPGIMKAVAEASFSTSLVEIQKVERVGPHTYLVRGFNGADSMGLEYTVKATSGLMYEAIDPSRGPFCDIRNIEKTFEE